MASGFAVYVTSDNYNIFGHIANLWNRATGNKTTVPCLHFLKLILDYISKITKKKLNLEIIAKHSVNEGSKFYSKIHT